MSAQATSDGLRALTVAEVAERLQIGRDSAYKLVQRSDFPAVRIGHLIRVPVPAFEKWLEQQDRQLVRQTAQLEAQRTTRISSLDRHRLEEASS